jgi:hypothetical protein
MPTIQFVFVHDYYPFAPDDGRRLDPTAIESVDRLAILVVVLRFPSLGAVGSRCLRSESCTRLKEFVRQSAYICPLPSIPWGRAS